MTFNKLVNSTELTVLYKLKYVSNEFGIPPD